jgi:undecaprenyl diphosphate synthase
MSSRADTSVFFAPDQATSTGALTSISEPGCVSLHVAIIMDGNGRWAKARHQLRSFGHHAGVTALRRTLSAAHELGISHLTVFAFSTENWRRPAQEVSDLMGLLRAFIKSDLKKLVKEGVRVRVIGSKDGLNDDVSDSIKDAEAQTRRNSKLNLQVALNYGAQADIVEAARQFAYKVKQGLAEPSQLTIGSFSSLLSTHDLPPLDLVIRTSGEQRLSNFLLWEAAYAEYVFQDILWPDYDKQALQQALDIYRRRDRRYGAVDAKSGT